MLLTIIYIDSIQRDGRWALDIQKNLQTLLPFGKNRVILLSRRNTWIMKYLNPDNIIVIGQLNIAHALTEKLRQPNIYFIPAECWLCNHEYEAMYPNDKSLYKRLKGIYFWGQKSLHWFTNNRILHNPDISLNVIGYPREQYLQSIKHHTHSKKNNIIGLVGRFSGINDLYHRPSLALIQSDESSYISRRLLVEVRVFNFYNSLINRYGNLAPISLRPHPNEDRHSYIVKSNYTIDQSIDNIKWFSSVSILVGCLSTSIIDAYFAGIPYICVDKLLGTLDESLTLEPALAKTLPFCILPDSEEQLYSILSNDPANLIHDINPKQTDILSIRQSFDANYLNSLSVSQLIISDLKLPKLKFTYLPLYLKRFLVIVIFRILDTIHQLYHYLFRPHRLLFDYANLFHVFK